MLPRQPTAEASRERRLNIKPGVVPIEQRDQKVRARANQNWLRRDARRIAQHHVGLALLIYREGLDGPKLWFFDHRASLPCEGDSSDVMGACTVAASFPKAWRSLAHWT